jgi:hypothetical protein
MTAPDLTTRMAELLHEAAEAHHGAYAATDGVDPDWSIWYADYLIEHGLGKLLGATFLKSDLIYLLVGVDKEQVAVAPGGNWERYYADYFIRRYVK